MVLELLAGVLAMWLVMSLALAGAWALTGVVGGRAETAVDEWERRKMEGGR